MLHVTCLPRRKLKLPIVLRSLFVTYVSFQTIYNPKERMGNEDVNTTACIIRITLFIVGSIAAVLALVAVTWYARRALKEALEVG